MNTVKSFTIYEEYYELITLLPEKEQGELLLRIVEYMFESKEPNLNDKQMKIFNNLKRPLDKSKNKSKNSSNSKSNENQNEIKTKSNENQNEIKTETHQDVNVIVNVNDNVNVNNNINLFTLIEQNFGRALAPLEAQEIQSWLEESVSEELVTYATKIAVCNNACSIKYISGILNGWKKKNITTVKQAQEDNKKFKERKAKKNITDVDEERDKWVNE